MFVVYLLCHSISGRAEYVQFYYVTHLLNPPPREEDLPSLRSKYVVFMFVRLFTLYEFDPLSLSDIPKGELRPCPGRTTKVELLGLRKSNQISSTRHPSTSAILSRKVSICERRTLVSRLHSISNCWFFCSSPMSLNTFITLFIAM